MAIAMILLHGAPNFKLKYLGWTADPADWTTRTEVSVRSV
jgi:hypothetical protein